MSLEKLFYDVGNPSSFSSLPKLKKQYKGKQNVKNWLQNQKTYSLHHPIIKKFNRRPTYSNDIDYLWQADLIDVKNIKKENKNFQYLLTCIDVFSKYAWAIPCKSKSAYNVTNAFLKILKTKRKPTKLQTDDGKEFLNKTFQPMLKKKNIHFYTTSNHDIKAAVVERFNRTLKTKMYKYFTAFQTKKYVHVLQKIVNSYNNSIHRTIGMTPFQASKIKTKKGKLELFNKIYSKVGKMKFSKIKYKIGDLVRISKYKGVFAKGYIPNWTNEIFIVKNVYKGKPNMYTIEDGDGEMVTGRFYAEEMLEFNGKIFEKLLKTKSVGGKKRYFVKYRRHKSEWLNHSEYNLIKN